MTRGIYIHIPFCSRICSYCDFFVTNDVEQVDKYLRFLKKEINLFTEVHSISIPIDNIYIGGGTPSLLTASQMESLLNELYSNFDIQENSEISMESNPASLDPEKMKAYKEAGINRISIGVQSFTKRELGLLKRNHSPKRAVKAVNEAREVGFDSINLDLIFSVPGQTYETWQDSLKQAVELGTDHISTYNLTFEEGTPLWNDWQLGKITKYDDETDEKLYFEAIDYLSEQGFEQYEISNFAKPGHKCKHNLNTWSTGEYLAFGASSHGYFKGKRYSNYRNLKKYYDYLDKDELPIENVKILDDHDKLEEFVMLGMRAEGLDLEILNNEFKLDLLNTDIILFKLLEEKNLIKISNNKLKLTKYGYAICDTITLKVLEVVEKLSNNVKKVLR